MADKFVYFVFNLYEDPEDSQLRLKLTFPWAKWDDLNPQLLFHSLSNFKKLISEIPQWDSTHNDITTHLGPLEMLEFNIKEITFATILIGTNLFSKKKHTNLCTDQTYAWFMFQRLA